MTTFQTLIFIPEGSLLDQKAAERNALRQTLKSLGREFGPRERIEYSNLQAQSKMLGLDDRIALILRTFCPQDLTQARAIFNQKMQSQTQLVKDAIPFLDEVKDQVNLVLLAKEERSAISARLQESELLNYFSASYFADEITGKFPDKSVFQPLLADQALTASTCLVIGTDLTDEIQAAENAGLASLWLAPKKVKMPIAPRPTLHLSKLSDLLFYLELS